MLYPFRSYAIAILCYLSIIIFIGFKEKNIDKNPMISLEIEADFVGIINQHQEKSTMQKEKNINKIQLPQISKKEFNEKQEIEPKQENKALETTNSKNNLEAKKIAPLFQPLPEIPLDMRNEAFSAKIIAKFYIEKDGSVSDVELLEISHNPRLNLLLLKSLKKWRFEGSNQALTQVISVKFAVE
jgi:outer membrane biosynthesis protein TonB